MFKGIYDFFVNTRVLVMNEKKFTEFVHDIASEVRKDLEGEYRERFEKMTAKLQEAQESYTDLEDRYKALELQKETEPLQKAKENMKLNFDVIKNRGK